MTIDDEALNQKRESIREQIQLGDYKSLAEIILDGIGKAFQKITRRKRPLSYLSSGLVIAAFAILLSFLVSLIANEFYTLAKLDVVWIVLWSVFTGYLSIVGISNVIRQLSNTVSESVLDSIQLTTDLENLQDWLISTSRIQRQLIFCFVFTFFMIVVFFSFIWESLGAQYPRFGLSIIAITNFFQIGLAIAYFLPLFNFAARVGTYKLKLYTQNPASSEVIEQLSHSMNQITLLGAGIIATVTFGFVFFDFVRQQFVLSLLIFSWIVFIIRFLTQQSMFTKIITRTKRVKLNSIQEQIEKLEETQNLADRNTIEAINRLMDYYDRIKNTPNSAINLRSGLSFLNSLLLPVVGFLLGNIETVLKLFFK